jgi:hypothetical protein
MVRTKPGHPPINQADTTSRACVQLARRSVRMVRFVTTVRKAELSNVPGTDGGGLGPVAC